ncbi:MAG TPA: hypothetical protein VFS43_16655 [Polyangiaceae bacterium]|nr:hypothetical protein [Polyangiaceae bacterium]
MNEAAETTDVVQAEPGNEPTNESAQDQAWDVSFESESFYPIEQFYAED